MKFISMNDFAENWGVRKDSIPEEFWQYFSKVNTTYHETDKADLENYFDAFIKKTTKATARRDVEENLGIFEDGWAEHRRLLEENFSIEAVMPKYYDNLLPYYIGPEGGLDRFENRRIGAEMQVLMMRYLALTWLKGAKAIHEFGSGSGLNLMALLSTLPGKRLIGYEWTQSGEDMANLIGKISGQAVSGRHFDMFNPDDSVQLEGEAALTVISIEQLGGKHEEFLRFLLRKKPSLVIHIEPDTSTAEGSVYLNLAKLYMTLRGYTLNLTQTLNEMADKGLIEVKLRCRLPWMSNFNNWMCTVWSPK